MTPIQWKTTILFHVIQYIKISQSTSDAKKPVCETLIVGGIHLEEVLFMNPANGDLGCFFNSFNFKEREE